jgi:hypothetical protein
MIGSSGERLHPEVGEGFQPTDRGGLDLGGFDLSVGSLGGAKR